MTRITTVVLFVCLVVGIAPLAQATPAITVRDQGLPDHQLANISPLQSNVISISYDPLTGGGPMQFQTLYISVADEGNGGLGNADPGEPHISSLDILTGTVWAGNNTGALYAQVNNQLWSVDVTTSSGTVNATGLAVRVTIERNGAPAGSIWGLRTIVRVPDLAGPYSSNWSNGASVGVAFQSFDSASGWNGVTGVKDGAFQYVPEPSSIALAALALAGLAVAARRKRS